MRSSAFVARFIKEHAEEQHLAELLMREGVEDYRMRLMMKRYHEACFFKAPETYSIVVEDRTGPVLLVPMVLNNGQLSYFNMPTTPIPVSRLNETGRSKATEAACLLAIDHCAKAGLGLTIERSPTRTQCHELAGWEVKLLQAGGRRVENYRGYVSLSSGEAGILRQIRKSYRSLVNWGRREMQLTFVDCGFADEQLFDAFRLFHLQVAGKVTRPLPSWEVMFDFIKERRAILGLGYLDGELVAATYFFFHGGYAYYGTGVYDRDRFDKPIAHWPLFATMVRASECGVQLCELSPLFPGSEASDKECNIAFFKKGFVDCVVDASYWQLDAENSQT